MLSDVFIKLTDKDNAPIYINRLTIISMSEQKGILNSTTTPRHDGFDLKISGFYDATKIVCGVNGHRETYLVKETPEEITKIIEKNN